MEYRASSANTCSADCRGNKEPRFQPDHLSLVSVTAGRGVGMYGA